MKSMIFWRGAASVRLLLDTATFIYAVESPDRLSRRAASAIRNSRNELELSTVSLAEIAIKASLGKLRIEEDSARRATEDLELRVLPFSVEHAFQLFGLALHHRDPFDRQLIAQALSEEIPIVTPDEAFQAYKQLKLLW